MNSHTPEHNQARADSEFIWPVRVYYEDTDSGGVVYYANYLRFMERARTEMLRSIGFEQDTLQQEQGLIFAVHSASIQYRKPARFNDELEVKTRITTTGKASIDFYQAVYLKHSSHAIAAGTLLADATIRIACLDAKTFSLRVIPSNIKQRIQGAFGDGS